jgi:hypothetical protein
MDDMQGFIENIIYRQPHLLVGAFYFLESTDGSSYIKTVKNLCGTFRAVNQ